MVRLPVAHCTLNPYELAWVHVKGHIKTNIRPLNLDEKEQLDWDGFAVVTPDYLEETHQACEREG